MKLEDVVVGNYYRMAEEEKSGHTVYLQKGAVVRVLRIHNTSYTLRINVLDTSSDRLDDGFWYTSPEKMEEFETCKNDF